MPSPPRPALRPIHLAALAALGVVPLAFPPASGAATTIGSSLAGAPQSACLSAAGCTATNVATAGPHPVTAPFSGVAVRFRLKHGPAPGAANYSLKVLSGGPATFAVEWQSAAMPFDSFSPAGVDVFAPVDAAGRPRGIPILAGQRIAAFAPGGVGFQSATAGAAIAEHDGDHAAGSAGYATHPGYEALINADIEPDADGDGYGDESQDNCPALANDQGSNPCPPPPPPAPASPSATGGPPAGYRRPRIGRLARARRSRAGLIRSGLSIPIRCHRACRAEGRLVMRAAPGRSLTVGRGRRRSAGGGFRLRLELTRRGRALLRRAGGRRVGLTLRVRASDAWGASSRRQRLVVSPR